MFREKNARTTCTACRVARPQSSFICAFYFFAKLRFVVEIWPVTHCNFPDLQPWPTSLISLRWPASTSPSWRRRRRRRKIPCPRKKVSLICKFDQIVKGKPGVSLSFLPSLPSHRTGESFIVKPLPSCTVHPPYSRIALFSVTSFSCITL